MQILHLTTSFPRHEGDYSGLFVYRLVRSLMQRRIDCRVLTPAHTGFDAFPEEVPTLRFNYAPHRWQVLGRSAGGIPQALKDTPPLAALLPPLLGSFVLHTLKCAKTADVIHAHWSICGAIAVITRSLHRKPVVTTLRGSDIHRASRDRAYEPVHRIAIGGSEIVVGVSRKITDDLEDSCPQLRERLRFVSNGVDDRFYAVTPGSRPQGPPVRFLFAGSLIALKGLDVLLKAFGLLKARKDWSLTLAGDGPELDQLAQLSTSLDIQSRVIFAGTMAPDRMPSLMQEHHALVLSSRREGRPNVVLEAMAAGLPVVGTDIGGVRELVQNGATGFLVPPEDEVLLAGALERFITRPDLLEHFGEAGRRWMLESGLTWEATASKYADIYEEVIQ